MNFEQSSKDILGTKTQLNNALKYNHMLFFDGNEEDLRLIGSFVEILYSELPIKFPNRTKSKKLKMLDNILANLLYSYSQGRMIYTPRNPKAYVIPEVYRVKHYSYHNIIEILDALLFKGYISIKKGYYKHSNIAMSKMTRIWLKNSYLIDKLSDYLLSYNSNQEQQVKIQIFVHETNYAVPVRLKNKEKQLINYRPFVIVHEIEKLNRYNKLINSHDIIVPRIAISSQNNNGLFQVSSYNLSNSLYIKNSVFIINEQYLTDEGIHIILDQKPTRMKFRHIDDITIQYNHNTDRYSIHSSNTHPTYTTPITSKVSPKFIYYSKLRTTLSRVYNNGSFDQGGRFYGAGYQNIPEKYRRELLINGNATVEIDYQALHLNMIFHINNLESIHDPYDIYNDRELRDVVKLLFNIAINASNYVKAKLAFDNEITSKIKDGNFQKDILSSRCLNFKIILRDLLQTHPILSQYLNTGYGVKLQYLDSKLALKIMEHFTNQDIPCLCVHDSFIVEQLYGSELNSVMKEVYASCFNGNVPITDSVGNKLPKKAA